MLTKADDFPVHQLPEPIATSGTDRNFYDRYFFNGYALDGEVFFACALGVYPHLNVMDGAFSVIADGVQHNVRASRLLNCERMDTHVGPIDVTVIEPLKTLRVQIHDNEYGITADLTFHARAQAIEEPRFIRRSGPRTIMDYTRLTQNGHYEGWIDVKGKRFEVNSNTMMGTRDRSWGVRPIGLPDQQAIVPPGPRQIYWIWAPLNFPDRFMLYHINADDSGKPWNTASVLGELGDAEPTHMAKCTSNFVYKSGTRHAKSTTIDVVDEEGRAWQAELTPHFNFYMAGIGYMNPDWGHGIYKGDDVTGYDTYDLATVNENDPLFQHVQAFVTARLTGPDGERKGAGVLEQLVMGPYAPAGFKDMLDPAP